MLEIILCDLEIVVNVLFEIGNFVLSVLGVINMFLVLMWILFIVFLIMGFF